MVYDPLSTAEIASGEPNKNETWDKVRTNFDDHESRLLSQEAGTNTQYPCAFFYLNGKYDQLVTLTDLMRGTTNFNIRITGVRLTISKAGSSGTTEIDIQKKSGVGAFTSIFTTRPSVAFGVGDNAVSSNAVLHTTERDGLAGDIYRVDLVTRQVGGEDFSIRVDYERI